MQQFVQSLIFAIIGTLIGCGGQTEPAPPLYEITGTITWNKKPLSQATVIFYPESSGAASSGMTDEQGNYQLQYQGQQPGAVAGLHRVEVRTGGEALDENGNILSETPEVLPARYNTKTVLRAEVNENTGRVNFDLTSR